MQTQHRAFQESLKSWDHNIAMLGILNPGRYCGFDTITPLTGMQFGLSHSQTGVRVKDPNNTNLGPYGKFVTKQGVIITEDEGITPLQLDPNNVANARTRYDVLIYTHNYQANTNSNPAVYQILRGGSGSTIQGPNLPQLPNPDRQGILAIFEVAPGATDMNGVRLIRTNSADTGEMVDAKLTYPNTFKGTQQWNQSNATVINTATDGFFQLENDGNTFWLNLNPNGTTGGVPIAWHMYALKLRNLPSQSGTQITLLTNHNLKVFDSVPLSSAQVDAGYNSILIPPQFTNFKETVLGTERDAIRPITGSIIKLELINGYWVVLDVQYYENATQLYAGQASAIHLDAATSAPGGTEDIPFDIGSGGSFGLSVNFTNQTTYGGAIAGVTLGGNTNGFQARLTGLYQMHFNVRLEIVYNQSYTSDYTGPGDIELWITHTRVGAAQLNYKPWIAKAQQLRDLIGNTVSIMVTVSQTMFLKEGEIWYPAWRMINWDSNVGISLKRATPNQSFITYTFLGGSAPYAGV